MSELPPSFQPYQLGANQNSTSVLSIISFVLAAVSVLFLPIVFGPAAIILAGIGLSKQERLAKIALPVAIVCMIAGFVLGYLWVKSQS